MSPPTRFIAIDTSSSPGSVAAGGVSGKLYERSLPPGGDQGRNLMPTLVELTEAAGWQLAEAELLAVAIGPGPFTGLRVGVTTAKALAWAAGCPLVAIPTAACLAAQALADRSPFPPVHVIFDAGRGELYAVIARPNGPALTATEVQWQLEETGLVSPEAWRDSLPPAAVVSGPGLAMASSVLAGLPQSRPDLQITPPEIRQPTATTVAQLGMAALHRNETVPPDAVTPIYLRASYAEEKKG